MATSLIIPPTDLGETDPRKQGTHWTVRSHGSPPFSDPGPELHRCFEQTTNILHVKEVVMQMEQGYKTLRLHIHATISLSKTDMLVPKLRKIFGPNAYIKVLTRPGRAEIQSQQSYCSKERTRIAGPLFYPEQLSTLTLSYNTQQEAVRVKDPKATAEEREKTLREREKMKLLSKHLASSVASQYQERCIPWSTEAKLEKEATRDLIQAATAKPWDPADQTILDRLHIEVKESLTDPHWGSMQETWRKDRTEAIAKLQAHKERSTPTPSFLTLLPGGPMSTQPPPLPGTIGFTLHDPKAIQKELLAKQLQPPTLPKLPLPEESTPLPAAKQRSTHRNTRPGLPLPEETQTSPSAPSEVAELKALVAQQAKALADQQNMLTLLTKRLEELTQPK